MNKKINRVIPKARNMWDDSHVFVSHVGNGHAVPVYEIDKKTNQVRVKVDKDGKPVTRDLYKEIQSFKGATDYKKIIEMNGGDLSVFDDPKGQKGYVDMTQFGTAEQVLNASAKLRAQGYDINEVRQAFENLMKRLNAVKQNVENKVSGEQKKPEESVKKDDKEKK